MQRVIRAVSLLLIVGCGTTVEPVGVPGQVDGPMRWADLGSACSTSAPATSLSAAARDSLPARDPNYLNVDDRWADVATRVPGGFGGYFLRAGVPVVVLVDTTRLAEALVALQSEAIVIPPQAVAQAGRWHFAQLHEWSRYLVPKVSLAGGVVSSDIQEAENRIELGVVDEAARTRVEAALRQVGIPCYLVATGIRGYVGF